MRTLAVRPFPMGTIAMRTLALRATGVRVGMGGFAIAAGFVGAAFGHIPANSPLPVGVRAEMDAGSGRLALLEAAVS